MRLKRTWFVCVEAGVGHELHDVLSEAEFYGPYSQATAEKLAADLNALYLELAPDDRERLMASALPLACMTPRDVLRECRREHGTRSDGEDGEDDEAYDADSGDDD